MDPQVYGKLLTHHRRSTNEDDEPLRDRVALREGGGTYRLDLVVLKLAAAGIVFHQLP